MNTQGYTVVEHEYREPADIAGRLRPERSTWTQYEIREYPNGDRIRVERECSRWASSGQSGKWEPEGAIEARRVATELRDLRKHVALFVETSQHDGRAPFPPIKGAEGPSPWASTWFDYLKRAAAKAPRVTSCMYPDDCAKAHAAFAEGETDKIWVGACGYCRAEHEHKVAATKEPTNA